MSARKIMRYYQAFDLLEMDYRNPKAQSVIAMLEKEGHTEKSICFAIWKGQNNLNKLKYNRDTRFWGAFINTVRKWSWPRGDPRWDTYWKRKKEEERAAVLEAELRAKKEKERKEKEAYLKRYPGFIYFIQGECGGPIKIGYTTDIKGRLNSLQTGYPDTLVLLGAFAGNTTDEHNLHEEYNSYRMRGEWFKPAEPILEKIRSLKPIEER